MRACIIRMESYHCDMFQSEISLFERYVRTNILQNIPSYSEILYSEIDYVTDIVSPKNPNGARDSLHYKQINDKATENAVFLWDVNFYILGMLIVAIYHFWERQITSHIKNE